MKLKNIVYFTLILLVVFVTPCFSAKDTLTYEGYIKINSTPNSILSSNITLKVYNKVSSLIYNKIFAITDSNNRTIPFINFSIPIDKGEIYKIVVSPENFQSKSFIIDMTEYTHSLEGSAKISQNGPHFVFFNKDKKSQFNLYNTSFQNTPLIYLYYNRATNSLEENHVYGEIIEKIYNSNDSLIKSKVGLETSRLENKAKEAELIKSKVLSIAKKKEIENLNQQRIINELQIKNKENEILRKNKETENKQKQILGLEHEKELSNENLKQQKFIRNLVIAGSGFLALFLVFVFVSLSKTKKVNKLIVLQQLETKKQKHLVEEKQKEIVDSISYAKRLQEAILPPQEFVNKHLAQNFIYYKPKDIVAGDFYWAEKVHDLFFIAAADSTGHGVPGAMVSVVCSNALNRAIKEFKLTETGKILDKTRDLVIETFEKSASEVKDGMDISLLCIDSKNKNIFWSGANNPLWYIQDSELKEIKADKQPIGKTDHSKPFTTHQIEYKENNTFYLFTDGFADQFGGPNGKKYKYKPFSDLLLKSNNLSQTQQADIINKSFTDWKGALEQVDDVCVIGIKI